LHRRLVSGDPTATADVAESYIDFLIAHLRKANRRVADEFLREAAGEALVSLFKNPIAFDPSRNKAECPLYSYLRMAAQRDLENRLRKESRHLKGGKNLKRVALSQVDGKHLSRDQDPGLRLEINEEVAKAEHGILAEVEQGLDDSEKRVLSLMLAQERKTSVYAEALEISHLSKEEQKLRVKNVKGMLKKRLQRRNHGRAS
jgi:hypothetical protein